MENVPTKELCDASIKVALVIQDYINNTYANMGSAAPQAFTDITDILSTNLGACINANFAPSLHEEVVKNFSQQVLLVIKSYKQGTMQ